MNERHGVFLVMMPSAYMALRLFEVEPLLRIAVQAVFAIVALAGVAWAFARSEDCDLKFAILAVGTFLASPYSFNYDMTTVSLARSEEHTSELQSLMRISYAVFCLKQTTTTIINIQRN